jgi:hypothetical protein
MCESGAEAHQKMEESLSQIAYCVLVEVGKLQAQLQNLILVSAGN